MSENGSQPQSVSQQIVASKEERGCHKNRFSPLPPFCMSWGSFLLSHFPQGFSMGQRSGTCGDRSQSTSKWSSMLPQLCHLASCLWPLAVSTAGKVLHTEEAGTWGMSPLLLWLGLLLCVSGKERKVRKLEDRYQQEGWSLLTGSSC